MCRSFERYVRETVPYEPDISIKSAVTMYDEDRVCPQDQETVSVVMDDGSEAVWFFKSKNQTNDVLIKLKELLGDPDSLT